jgi:hypothetical protein
LTAWRKPRYVIQSSTLILHIQLWDTLVNAFTFTGDSQLRVTEHYSLENYTADPLQSWYFVSINMYFIKIAVKNSAISEAMAMTFCVQ